MSVMNSSDSSEKEGHADVNLAELLSTCIDACRRGCEVIRNVRYKSLHCTDILDPILYKIADDPRSALTEADGASQKVIIECLTCCWEKQIEAGLIKIVGEEEDEHSTDLEGESFDTAYSEDILSHFDNYNAPRPDHEPIHKDIFSTEKRSSKGDEIIIFIDPMDGTREFIEGRIQNVQCLIGITVNGMPVGGVMGMPMVHGSQIEVAYGLISPDESERESSLPVSLLSGVKFFDALNALDTDPEGESEGASIGESSVDNDDNALMVLSGDSTKPALKLAMDCLENRVLGGIEPGNIQEGDSDAVNLHPPVRKIVAGGCGNKLLTVARHFQCISERQEEECSSSQSYPPTVGSISVHAPGSSSWDTAAPTAVLLAIDPKARVTDLMGKPLIYDGDNLLNKCGVIVSSGHVASMIHEKLCQGLCEDEELCEVIGVGVGFDDGPPLVLDLDACLQE